MNADEIHITRRGSEQITRRGDAGVTRRGGDPLLSSTVTRLNDGDLIDGRYKILCGPLGGASGEAEVFCCEDIDGEGKLAVKVYYYNYSPKLEVLKQLRDLVHKDVVRLLDWGEWNGRFFEVAEYCAGGTVSDVMPITEDVARHYLVEIVEGLRYLHNQERPVIHRDIKPTNLYFRDVSRTDIVIGDFGISSALQDGQDMHVTTTANRFTEIYVAPEARASGNVQPKTDYYSMGITLIVLLFGHSPFTHANGIEFSSDEIYEAKKRGQIPLPEWLSERFILLLKGLIRFHPKNRWGYEQVQQWIQDERILRDDGSPDREELYGGLTNPYPRDRSITTPEEMARSLYTFDAKGDLFRGVISKWLFEFSPSVSDSVVAIEENYTNRKDVGVFKLQFVLDPTLPLTVGRRQISDLKELHIAIIDALDHPNDVWFRDLGDLFFSEKLECWIDACLDVDRKIELLGSCVKLRKRLNDRWLGLFSLALVLNPRTAFPLTDGIKLTSPDEIENAIDRNPASAAAFRIALFGGRVTEWLRGAFPTRIQDISFLENVVRKHIDNIELGVMAARWRFAPELGIQFDGTTITDPVRLAEAILEKPSGFQMGIILLQSGFLREWLLGSGRLQSGDIFDKCVSDEQGNWNLRLQSVLTLLAPNALGPKLAIDPKQINLGSISIESEYRRRIRIFNSGRGYLAGEFHLSGEGDGLSLQDGPAQFEDNPVEVTVIAQPRGLPAGSTHKGILEIRSNGGIIEFPITFVVGMPWFRMIARSMCFGLLPGACFFGLRFLAGQAGGSYQERLLPWRPLSSFFTGDFLTGTLDGSLVDFPLFIAGLLFTVVLYAFSKWLIGRARIR